MLLQGQVCQDGDPVQHGDRPDSKTEPTAGESHRPRSLRENDRGYGAASITIINRSLHQKYDENK